MKPQFPTEHSESGEFQRQEDAFREWISVDGSTAYPAVAGRYHLYVSLACPWASRTLIFRKLKGLEDAIAKIGEELHSQYIITYSPNNKDQGGWHEIKVTVTPNRDLKVKCRPGYWLASVIN